jgi:quinol-cytochrome oxidoreductase complex cytochrome b subunit
VLLTVALLVLVVSGAWLWFRYQPRAAQQWADLARKSSGDSSWIRTMHRYTADITLVLALSTLVLLIGSRIRTSRRGVVAGVGVLVTAVAASITGDLLPWDQLALWAVTVGSNSINGVQATFDSRVKYILIGTREVSPGTYHFWSIAHVVLGVLVAVAVLLAWLRTREARRVNEAELVRSS